MAVFCISYDLKNDNYEPLIEAIRAYGTWWHQSKSTWFIETDKTAKQIFENLNPHLYKNDKLIVVKIQENWWATGHSEKEYKWMKDRSF